jgi:hypothetical protein
MRLLCLLTSLLFTSQAFGQNINNSIKREDNDYVTFRDLESLKERNPPAVRQKFKSILDGLEYHNTEFYSYRIAANANLDIYVLITQDNFRKDCYVIAYDKAKSLTSKTPIFINMKWSSNNESAFHDKLLAFPLLKVIETKENVTIHLKERQHNGNIYNAVITKIFVITPDLSFDALFCYENNALTFDNRKIKRILNHRTISVYSDADNVVELVGIIEIDEQGEKITERKCYNDEYCDILFTTSDAEDEVLLRRGNLTNY